MQQPGISIMATTTIRVSPEAHRILKMLSDRRGVSMVEALDEIVSAWERDHFFQELNEAYAALKVDGAAWQEELAERKSWDVTLMDNQGDAHVTD
jgi:hypothetical protein